ncbi:hypothetical protein [Lyngbya aestuarii]|uniref:hypothetical protein n=1 Tax=Lyngbya aestuarii TaxID=118322 RepID=UPI00403E1904
MDGLIIKLHDYLGEMPFLVISGITAVICCFWLIPQATDLMTNSAAGLAEKILGRDQRTLVINSSTNNPELLLMLVSLSIGRLGGIGTPLGSNFANLYLMFIVAPLIVLSKWLLTGKLNKITSFIALLIKEKKLFFWHLSMSLSMFLFSSTAYWCITGIFEFEVLPENMPVRNWHWLLFGGITCIFGVLIFFISEKRLKKNRPELFDDITDDNFEASWLQLFWGTAGLLTLCYALNSLFLAWTELYSTLLSNIFGGAVFVSLHYFVGSLISSLPETIVAVENYERLTPPDFNTALASASQSNMTNLAIGCLGSILASIFLLAGINYRL